MGPSWQTLLYLVRPWIRRVYAVFIIVIVVVVVGDNRFIRPFTLQCVSLIKHYVNTRRLEIT